MKKRKAENRTLEKERDLQEIWVSIKEKERGKKIRRKGEIMGYCVTKVPGLRVPTYCNNQKYI
jgi:hypothetical protein